MRSTILTVHSPIRLFPSFAGIDSFDYTITDANGDTSTATVTVTVAPPEPPSSLTLVQTINAWQWSPPSPDSSGIVYIAHRDTLLVTDGEVDEMPTLFTGDNLFEMNRNGNLVDTLTTIGFSDEPTGAAYNPNNHHLFFADDTGTRSVYELDPGAGRTSMAPSDDVVTSFRTASVRHHRPRRARLRHHARGSCTLPMA